MSKAPESLKYLLEQWGRKCCAYNNTGVGYPTESIEYKLMREAAGAGMAGRNITMIVEDDEYERVNVAILNLRQPIRQVVVMHYARPDIRVPWRTDYFPLGKTAFYNRLSAGHRQLGHLVG